MALSKEDVLKVAKLARIELTDQEVEKFQGQLSGVLTYIEQLQAVDTDDVPETAQVTGLENVSRPDAAKPVTDEDRKATIAQAPQHTGNLVRVTSVF
jgi:aspartyl-tRNA(Asn)/glutamyl-tRNA(Gln) amidotransferase subunit C